MNQKNGRNNFLIINDNFIFDESIFKEQEIELIFLENYFVNEEMDKLVTFVNSKNSSMVYYKKKFGLNDYSAIDEERAEIVQSFQTKEQLEDLEYFYLYTPLNTTIYKKTDINVVVISDEIQYHTLENIANFYYLNKNTLDDVKKLKVDFILFITSWHGLYKEYASNTRIETKRIFHYLIDEIKSTFTHVPVVFYSKEDPPNYKMFVEYAKKSDIILTSSIAKINEYQETCNNTEVYNFTYGINPMTHNPIGTFGVGKKDAFLFAGSWLNGKYVERLQDAELIFDFLISKGNDIKIFDRNSFRDDPFFFFPRKYQKYIEDSKSYIQLLEEYKKYTNHINLNSVKDDRSMCAVRVYELQAMGKNIVSNVSNGNVVSFPNITYVDKNVVNTDIDFNGSKDKRMQGVRNIYNKNTSVDFLALILEKIGYLSKIQHFPQIYIESKVLNSLQTVNVERIESLNMVEEFEYIVLNHELINQYPEYIFVDALNSLKYTNANIIQLGIKGGEHEYTDEESCEWILKYIDKNSDNEIRRYNIQAVTPQKKADSIENVLILSEQDVLKILQKKLTLEEEKKYVCILPIEYISNKFVNEYLTDIPNLKVPKVTLKMIENYIFESHPNIKLIQFLQLVQILEENRKVKLSYIDDDTIITKEVEYAMEEIKNISQDILFSYLNNPNYENVMRELIYKMTSMEVY